MSRMAKEGPRHPLVRTAQSTRSGKTIAILSILAVCLALHFLVEDIILLQAMEISGQPASQEARLGLDETGHQDDLVMLASQPARIGNSSTPTIQALVEPLHNCPVTPLRHPPKG